MHILPGHYFLFLGKLNSRGKKKFYIKNMVFVEKYHDRIYR